MLAQRTDKGSKRQTPGERPLAYSIAEAAHALRVSERTIHRLIEDGLLRSVKLPGRRIIPHVSINKLLNPG
jgi:excisionase family DNA binding protein